jgi:hypothetical protein
VIDFLAIARTPDGSTTLFKYLRHAVGLEHFLNIHLLKIAVFFEFFHERDHRYVHAAEIGTPFIKMLPC